MKVWRIVVVGVACMIATAAFGQLRDGLLPIDRAYEVTARIERPGVVTVQFVIAPDYYLYRGRMHFLPGKGTELEAPQLPEGIQEDDPYFGNVEIYHGKVAVHVPYSLLPGATHVNLTVGYQGCHEVIPLVCYPPHSKTFSLPLPPAVSARSVIGAGSKFTAFRKAPLLESGNLQAPVRSACDRRIHIQKSVAKSFSGITAGPYLGVVGNAQQG